MNGNTAGLVCNYKQIKFEYVFLILLDGILGHCFMGSGIFNNAVTTRSCGRSHSIRLVLYIGL